METIFETNPHCSLSRCAFFDCSEWIYSPTAWSTDDEEPVPENQGDGEFLAESPTEGDERADRFGVFLVGPRRI